jgi:hypothetical protein
MDEQIVMDERKQVTVLFADLSGFTSLSEELDPEEISTLLNTSFEGRSTRFGLSSTTRDASPPMGTRNRSRFG